MIKDGASNSMLTDPWIITLVPLDDTFLLQHGLAELEKMLNRIDPAQYELQSEYKTNDGNMLQIWRRRQFFE